MTKNTVLAMFALVLIVPTTVTAEITWVGGVSADVFDEGNWDLSNSSVAVIDENVTIADDMIIGAGGVAEIPNSAGQVRLQLGNGQKLTIDGGIISPVGNDGFGGEGGGDADPTNDGINGPIVDVINGGQFNPFFIVHNVRLNIDSESSATFGGGGNPINLSSVDLSPGATLGFTAETPEAFTNEHLSKIFVDGMPAVTGQNIQLDSDGANGSIITAVPEPSSYGLFAIAACLLLARRRRD